MTTLGGYEPDEVEFIDTVSAGHVMTAIRLAMEQGHLEAIPDLLLILAAKDPHAADLITRTIQYAGRTP